jgi:GNAT superfamily N-acetyltransferase
MSDLAAPEPLDSAHDLAAFDSGVASLDDWLRGRALAEEKRATSRSYVISVAGRVVGYYSLAIGAVIEQRSSGKRSRSRPDAIAVMVVSRLALDKAHQGEGLGRALVRDAVLRTQQAAAMGGIRAIMAHALSEPTRRFYEGCGFSASPVDPMTLMVGVADVEKILRDR